MARLRLLIAACISATLLWPSGSTATAATSPPGIGFAYFPETGHNIGLTVKRFYDSHGGLEIFGLPLTEVVVEDGLSVQYFERARFELRPEVAGGVALSLLGSQLTAGRSEAEFQWLSADPGGDRRFFPESGHTLGGAFRDYWERRGGLVVFGYPISEELTEPGPDSAPVTVQYFQRARFELHPEAAFTPQIVQLGHLGRQALSLRPEAAGWSAPAPQLAYLGGATTAFPSSSYERRTNIKRATVLFDGVVVQPGEEYSFLGTHDFSEEAGFVDGYAIVGGKLEKVIGGGLCQVSTTMFRAVSNAGLEITRRVGHTYMVYFYENIPGFDATVFSPQIDFRWRNDTPGPVVISAWVNDAASTVTFELWGTSDGRQVSYVGPNTRNHVQPGPAVWQYSKSLPAGSKEQLVHGRPGMDVSYARTVKLPDGRVLHRNTYTTHYRPWADFYMFGPGVVPPAGAVVIR